MSKSLGEISINVGVQISEETVNRCICLLGMWLDDNPTKTLEVQEFHDVSGITREIYIRDKVAGE